MQQVFIYRDNSKHYLKIVWLVFFPTIPRRMIPIDQSVSFELDRNRVRRKSSLGPLQRNFGPGLICAEQLKKCEKRCDLCFFYGSNTFWF